MGRFAAQKESRTYAALFAVACVLFLCWGQQSGWAAASCPQGQHQQLDAASATHVVADCDSASHLLQQAHLNILDGGVALTLFITLVVILTQFSYFVPVAQGPPPLPRRLRPHLLFCVFHE